MAASIISKFVQDVNSGDQMAEPFLAGASEIDITPPVDLPMDGYMARVGVSHAVHDPLLAQVLLLDDSHRRVAVVALDVMAVGAVFADELRRSLAILLEE